MTPLIHRITLTATLGLMLTGTAPAMDFGAGHWVDLTHEFSDHMPSHPRSQEFVHTPGMVGMTRGGFFMSTYNYSGSEHVGTHVDAPVHFHESGKSVDQVPFQQLMGDVIVVDIKRQVEGDMNYLASVDDLLLWEKDHGRIPDNSIVMFNTGLANVWPDSIKYSGTDKRGNEGLAELKNPGIHQDATIFLTSERKIKAVGIDSLSFDNSKQADRMSHRILFEHDIPGVENIANLDLLPAKGAYMIGLPMKIKGGSAAPIRIIAFIPD